jgi:3-carboxy-cis,cis-muconate cycloisomerase
LGEQRAIADLVGRQASATYVGAADRLIDASLSRAAKALAQRW